MPRPSLFLFVSLLPVATLAALPAAGRAAWDLDAQRRTELRTMLVQDCGSCHGLTMKGGLGTPLTPDALAGRSDEDLINTILLGRPGTAMPPWEPMLERDEAAWMVERLREGVAP